MYLALTYDHRLLDGREAVTFLVKVCVPIVVADCYMFSESLLNDVKQVKQFIEDPRRMLLG